MKGYNVFLYQNIIMHYKYLNHNLRTFVDFLDQSIYALFATRPADFHLRPTLPIRALYPILRGLWALWPCDPRKVYLLVLHESMMHLFHGLDYIYFSFSFLGGKKKMLGFGINEKHDISGQPGGVSDIGHYP